MPHPGEKCTAVPVDTADHQKGIEHGEAVLEGGDKHGDVGDEDEQLDEDHKQLHMRNLIGVFPAVIKIKFKSMYITYDMKIKL